MAGQPPSPSASSLSNASWTIDPSPIRHQSITELLHDPRESRNPLFSEYPSFSNFPSVSEESSSHAKGGKVPGASSSSETPAPTINDFADYLREVAEPYASFLKSREDDGGGRLAKTKNATEHGSEGNDATASASDDDTVPESFFANDFSIAHSPQLAALQASAVHPMPKDAQVVKLRATLESYRTKLEARMRNAMSSNTAAIEEALLNVAQLRKAVQEAAEAAKRAKREAEHVVDSTARGAIEINTLNERKESIIRLKIVLSGVSRVLTAAEDAHALVDAGEYAAAMDAVDGARAALEEPDLSRVQSMSQARARLARAVERIDSALRDDFRSLLVADRVDDKHVADVARLVARLGRSKLALRAFLDDVRRSLEAQLQDAVSVDEAAAAARAAARRSSFVNRVFEKAVADHEAEVQASTRSEEQRDASQGPECANGITAPADGGVTEAANDTNTTIQRHASEESGSAELPGSTPTEKTDTPASEPPPSVTKPKQRSEVLDAFCDNMLDMLCTTVDRLLGSFDNTSTYIVVLDEAAVTSLNYFDEAKGALRFGDTIRSLEHLADEVEEIFGLERKTGGKANALRLKIYERSLAFVNAIHRMHSESLTKSIESEKWAEVRVPHGVLRLVACLTGDELPALDEAEQGPDGPNKDASGSGTFAPAVTVHDVAFKTVRSGLRYVRSICAFALFADKLPYAGSEAARRGVELMRTFNSMCGRAILGAAALQWAGLRSITARHLSLASRTIALSAALAPHVSGPLQGAVLESQAAVVGSLLQRVENDMRDHHGELLAKIMSIMMDRLGVHEEALETLPWSKQLEMIRFEMPSAYVATLAREATVLHRILWSILPREEVFNIFRRVCATYGSRLSEQYSKLKTSDEWVYIRVTGDVEHLYDKLAALDVHKGSPEIFTPIEALYREYCVELRDEKRRIGAAAAASSPSTEVAAGPDDVASRTEENAAPPGEDVAATRADEAGTAGEMNSTPGDNPPGTGEEAPETGRSVPGTEEATSGANEDATSERDEEQTGKRRTTMARAQAELGSAPMATSPPRADPDSHEEAPAEQLVDVELTPQSQNSGAAVLGDPAELGPAAMSDTASSQPVLSVLGNLEDAPGLGTASQQDERDSPSVAMGDESSVDMASTSVAVQSESSAGREKTPVADSRSSLAHEPERRRSGRRFVSLSSAPEEPDAAGTTPAAEQANGLTTRENDDASSVALASAPKHDSPDVSTRHGAAREEAIGAGADDDDDRVVHLHVPSVESLDALLDGTPIPRPGEAVQDTKSPPRNRLDHP